jgi:hypothetical protein
MSTFGSRLKLTVRANLQVRNAPVKRAFTRCDGGTRLRWSERDQLEGAMLTFSLKRIEIRLPRSQIGIDIDHPPTGGVMPGPVPFTRILRDYRNSLEL